MISERPASVHAAAEALAAGDTTAVKLIQACLDRIDAVDDEINAFISVDGETALKLAAESDGRRKSRAALSPWDGVPIAVKDCIAVAEQPCRCASKILQNFVSPYDSTVVERLKRKGFIPLGRTNMDEFAMGSSCENSAYQTTRNPWDLDRVPGGSSGGSAAAVAAAQVPAALGSDTGGSVRQPAAFCGVVGIKPTYGLVSRYGLVAYASSLDQIGPLTRDVRDGAIILETIAGADPRDATSLPEAGGDFVKSTSVSPDAGLDGVKIGLPKEYLEAGTLSSAVVEAMETAKAVVEKLGAELVEVSLPRTKYAIAAYYIIATAEASANLARYDGVRYGERIENADDLISTYFRTRGRGFGEEVKRRIILGTYVLSGGYHDAYYLRAQKVRTLIREDFTKAFERCDLMLAPVCPTPAFKIGEKTDPLQMYLTDVFTNALNLSGNCGVAVPATLDAETGVPIGLQFIGPHLGERDLLRIARTFELNRPMRKFIPNG